MNNKKAATLSTPKDGLMKVSYHNLLKAANGFSSSNLIGVGNFVSIYKGLSNQTKIIMANTILHLARGGASKSFIAKCEAFIIIIS